MEKIKRRKRKELADRKNIFVYWFWMLVNKILVAIRFKDFQVIGKEALPKSGPFLLVANHTSRWDGLIVYHMIGRPANFMVSPNELLGTQGIVLSSMGSFPADPRADLLSHSINLFKKGEGIVVFPEGNTFRDGSTHSFKLGAARIAQAAAEAGIDLPIIPCAIHYAKDGQVAQIALGNEINAKEYFSDSAQMQNKVLRYLSEKLQREVCFLKAGLGSLGDQLALFTGPLKHHWPEMLKLTRYEHAISEKIDNSAVLLTLSLPVR